MERGGGLGPSRRQGADLLDGEECSKGKEVWELLEKHALGACAYSTPERCEEAFGYDEAHSSPAPISVPAGATPPGIIHTHQDGHHGVWPLPVLWLHL